MKHIGLFDSGFSSMIQSKSTTLGLISTPIVENAALYLFKDKQPNFSDLDLKIQAATTEGIKSFLTSQADVRIPLVLNISKVGNNVLLSIAQANHDLSTNKARISKFPSALSNNLEDAVPAMTSQDQDGYVISSSSIHGAGYEAFKAFSKTLSPFPAYGWLSGSNPNGTINFGAYPEWIQVEFPAPTIIKALRLRNGYEPNIVRGTLTASHDNQNWAILCEINSISTSVHVLQDIIYTSNDTAFKYYRVNIYQTSSTDKVGIGELYLYKQLYVTEGILYGVNNYSIKYGVPIVTPILPLPVKVPVEYENLQTFYGKSVLSGSVTIGLTNKQVNHALLAGEIGDLRYSYSGEQRDNLGTAFSLCTDTTVDANCIVMYITPASWPRSTAPIKFYIHDDQDVVHEIPLAEYAVDRYVKINFERKLVKGLSVYTRGIESRQTVAGMRYCSFNVLTLGLDTVQVSQTDNELDYTAALLVLDEDASVRVTQHVPPMLVMSISNGTSTDLTITDSKKKIVKASDITMKAILALPLVGN